MAAAGQVLRLGWSIFIRPISDTIMYVFDNSLGVCSRYNINIALVICTCHGNCLVFMKVIIICVIQRVNESVVHLHYIL